MIPSNPPKIARGMSGVMPVLQDGQLYYTEDTNQLWVGSVQAGKNVLIGGPGSNTNLIGDLDANAAGAKGITIQTATGTLYMQSATASVPGLVNTGTQTFAGNKTFAGDVIANMGTGTPQAKLTNYSVNVYLGGFVNFWDNTNAHAVGIFAPASVSASYDLQLPSAQGGANTVPLNDGAGNLSWLAETNANTAGALVRRDGSGNFAAGTVTASLTGAASLNVLSSAVNAANGVCPLDSSSKVPAANLPSTVMEFQGSWNPNTNSPTLADGTGTAGNVYWVSAAKATAVSGLADSSMVNFEIGDLIIYSSVKSAWELSSPAAGVQAVNGAQGAVVLTVASTNGFVGTWSAGALTLSTSITGLIKGNGTAISAATAGTDYSAGTSALVTGILKSTTTTGALTIAVAGDFPTLNQNTSGLAATATAPASGSAHGAATLDSSGHFQSVAPGAAGHYLRSNATDYVDSAIQAGDVPTLNQNTTGLAGTATAPAAGSAHGAVTLDGSGHFQSVAPGTSGNVLQSNGTDWVSAAAAAATYTAPTVQKFTAAPTGATNYTFTITSHAFTKGDTYTNNGATFTVLSASATSTTVIMSGTNTPAASGTLTWASGGGSGNITFSAFTGAYVLPTSPAPLYLRVRMAGGGGGGGQSGTSGGTNAVAGTATTFGSSLLTANGGGACVFPGTATAGGTATISAPAYGTAITGGTGAGPIKVTASGVYALGSPGGSTPHFGGGAAVSDFNTLTGIAGVTNTGGGGSGAGIAIINGIAGGGGGSGGFVDAIIPSPSSLYTCTVGGGGAAGLLGASGFGGGAGAAGIIEVTEYYQ